MSRAARRRAEREASKAPPKLTISKARQQTAFHEAAHAVASVRLGLPLASTDIRRRVVGRDSMPSLADGQVGISSGYTTLVEGSAEAWSAALPDPEARENLECLAVQAAAGVVAEIFLGGQPGDPEARDDLHQVVQIGGVLGFGESNQDPAMQKWMGDCVSRASDVLLAEGEGDDAVERVAEALLEHERLSGDQVREIVGGELQALAEELRKAGATYTSS